MNNSKWLIFLSLIFIPFLGVEANTDFMYRAQDGKNPYLFVFKDEDGGSKRSPGIYIFRDKGEPELIFRGDILKGGTIQGNLEEFPISKETRLYESVVILDEKILIFDLNSDASDTSTFLQIGSRELLLHDPFSGEVVILDSVRTLQDISIYSLNVFHESNYFLQPVLFSVKQHGSFGNGVTFLVLFKSSDNSKKLEIVRTEVLDYRFYNTSELKKLDPATSQSDLCIVSPLYLKFYGRPQAKEPHYVARWRQRLREYVDKRGWEIAHSIEFPFFEYLSGQVRMYQYPIMCLPDTCPSGMAQYYDPTGGRSGIYFNKQSAMSGALDADARPLSRGTFDFNPSRPTELLVAHIDSNDMVVGYIDGVLWVVKEKIELENNFRTFLPDELSVYGQSENGMIYIFVSRKWPDVSAYTDETKVFILKSDGRGAYSLWRSVDLTQSCFTRSNLKWRIRKMGTNGLLFDPHTPPQDSVIAYQQNADDTLPFIDILRTAESGSLHYTYIKALKETKVLPNLVYREYQPTKITENKTGFYLIIKGREYFLPGQFLTAPVSATFASRSTNGELLSVDDVSAKDNNKKIKIKGSLLAIDSAFHSGAESFSLTFALSAPEETSVVPSFVNTPILVPFDRFDGVRILQGKKVNAGDLFFLVFIKPPNAKTVSKNIVYPSGGVILVTIKGIELKQAASDSGDSLSIAFSSQQSTTLSNVYLSPSDLKDRIVPDSGKGGFYWKIDPSAKRTDPQCFYMDLFSGASVLFQSLSQGVQGAIRSEKTRDAKSNEGVEGDDDYALGYHGRYRADWRVYGSHDLLERMGIKVFDQPALLQTLKQFPRLTEMLDKLANPQSPNQFEVILVEEAVTRDALKALVTGLLEPNPSLSLMYWNHDRREQLGIFTIKNPADTTQSKIIINLAEMATSTKRNILLASVPDIVMIGGGTGRTKINDSDKTDSPQKIKPWVDDGSSPDGVLPHFLHFLASFLTSEDRKLVEPAELSEALRNLSRLAFSGLIFSTRAEWDAMKRGLNNDVPPEFWSVFHENTSYLSGSWQVPAPDVWLDASTSGAQGAEFSRTQVEESLFPSLTKLLDDIGGQKSTPKKRILLVPAEIKNLILTLIKQRWSLVNGVVRPWSYRNERLKLYELPSVLRVEQNKDYLAQDRALDNLTILGLLPDEIRPVLVGDLATALKYNRPNYVQQSGRTVLLLSDTACQGDPSQHLLGSRVTTAKTPASSPVQNTVPHLLWLLASESKFLPPEKMLQLTNGSMPARQDMLMVGTPEEWQAIQHQLETFEYRFPGFRDLFSVESLAQPSIGDRLDILLNLFSDSYLKTLGINFENTDNADKTKRSLLTYFITRCDRLAKDTKKDEIAQFLYAVDELGKALIQDPTLRGKSGAVLDKRFFDRFFSRIFNIPIDVNSLPDDDWFRKLSDSRTMLVALGSPPVQDEKTGRNESVPAHTGSTRIKNELLRIFTANLRAAHDDGHTIPNSFIFLGKQGSGKTHFIKKLIEIGKLKLYDFSRPTDESAQVFYINCRNLSAASEKSTAGVVEKIKISASEIGLTADEIILHLKNFLSLPYGYRGAIYFDDLSAAPTDALQKILTFIQSLFDAPGGMFGIMDSSGEKREIPLKNLTLGVIINPTEDEEQLRKFGVYSTYPPQDTKVIIATLSRGERPIDASFISRFSAVKNFSELDASAKGPALLERVAGKNKSTFGQDGKIMFVSLNAANQIVTLAGDVGAREFFAPALSGMQALSCSQEDKITIIVSRNELGMPESGAGTSVPQAVAYGSFRSASGTSGTEIETKIVEQFISIPINLNQYEGRLLLLKIMMNSFRINLLKFFVETLLDDARYTETPLFASDQVPYILQAVLDHVDIVSEFPINAMKLDPDQFGARTDVAREKFQTVLSNLSKNEVPMNRVFPVQYGQANDTGKFSLFGVASTSDSPGRDRSQILAGVVRNVRSLLGPLLGSFFRVSHEGSSNIDTWKTNLSKADPEKEFKTAGNALLTTYGGLYLGLVQADLRETILHDRYESITAYDQAKLFLIALDQAISLLPWGEMLQFMMQVLSSVKGDYGAYQHPGMLHFLFEGKLTPMHLATTDILKLIIESNPIYGEYKRGNPAPLKEPWFNKCEKLLASGGGRST